jgi:hypothetical protein
LRKTAYPAAPTINDRTPAELKLSDAAWNHAQCWNDRSRRDESFEKTIIFCKKQLLTSLSTIESAHALRDYFEGAYPTAGDALAALRGTSCGPCGSDSGRLKSIGYAFPQRMGVSDNPSESQKSLMSDWFVSWVSKRLTYKPGGARLVINIRVTSHDKDQAIFTLYYWGSETKVGDVTTQNTLMGITRGKYRYVITRPRYKPMDTAKLNPPGFLNLVDWDWSDEGLSCTLVREKSQLDTFCNLQ